MPQRLHHPLPSATLADIAITTRVRATLAADSDLSALAIDRATLLAKAVTGVVDVRNNLTLVKKP